MSIRYKRTNWVRFGRLLPAWLLAGFISSLAFAAVPVTTNYQGYLENTDGEPLDATVNMTFALYGTAQGGSVLWTETHQNVEVTDGVFSLILGDTTSFDDNSLEGERYLGVTVGSDPEMAPRQQLTSAFFAMRAGVADSVKAASVETEAIADGAVTADKIAADVTITAAERSKLESIALVVDNNNNSIQTLDQLNVNKHLKVGENSLHIDAGTANNAPENHIYSSGSESLLLQANNGNGNVGIGEKANAPELKLEVDGSLKLYPTTEISSATPSDLGKGLFFSYDEKYDYGKDFTPAGEIMAFDKDKFGMLTGLSLRGNPIMMNMPTETGQPISGKVAIGYSYSEAKKAKNNSLVVKNQVGIGTLYPKTNLDVEGSAIIGDYSGNSTSYLGENSLLVSGRMAIGYSSEYDSDFYKLQYNNVNLSVNGGLRAKKGNTSGDNSNVGYAFEFDGDTGMFAVGGTGNSGSDLVFNVNNAPRLALKKHGEVEINNSFYLGVRPEKANSWISMVLSNNNVSWDTDIKKWKRKGTGPMTGVVGWNEKLYFLSRGGWQTGSEWTKDEFLKDNTTMYVGSSYVGINTIKAKHALDVHGNIGVNGVYHVSDKRWKKDIIPLENSLEKVSKLQGVAYKWNTENYPDMNFDAETHLGFIAQEVEPVIPELVSTDDEGYKSVSYENVTAVLVEAVKELKAQNDALKAIVCEDHPEKAICQ